MSFLRFLVDHLDSLTPQALTQVRIVLIVVVVASITGIGLGVVAVRVDRLAEAILGVASTILTIPSFALFGLLVIALQQIGDLPIIIGLALYAQLPIIRNTVTGIRAVRPEVVRAALGMGMRQHQVLLRVELPLALPVLIGGIRQATVMVTAIATIGAYFGVADLGQTIFAGDRAQSLNEVLSGVVPVALIGILADLGLAGVQRLISRGRITAVSAT